MIFLLVHVSTTRWVIKRTIIYERWKNKIILYIRFSDYYLRQGVIKTITEIKDAILRIVLWTNVLIIVLLI